MTRIRLPAPLAPLASSRLARQVSKLWGSEAVVLGSGFLQAVVVARVLGPRDYGTAALVVAFPTLVFTIFDPQSAEAVVRYTARFRAEGDLRRARAVARLAYAVDAALAVAGLAVIATVSGWAAAHVVKTPEADRLIIGCAAGIALAAPASTSRAVLATFNRFGTIASTTSITAIVRTTLIVALVARGWGVAGVVVGSVVASVVDLAVTGLAAHRAMCAELDGSWSSSDLIDLTGHRREIARFMLYTELTSLVAVFVKQADVVVLGWARGPREVGYYRLARSLLSPISSIVVPLQRVLYPQISHLVASGGTDRVFRTFRRHATHIGAPLSVALVASLPFLDLVVEGVAGSRYLPAVPAARILIAGSAVGLLLYWVRPAYLALNLVRPLFVISTVAAVAGFAAYFIGAALAGDVGVAVARGLIAGALGSAMTLGYLLWWRRAGVEALPVAANVVGGLGPEVEP